ncbi:uncharacterized protein CDV56_106187 [Aspergillus thermomutatus]|uniref:Uncharacterized protein n=1 Tax=Aspergillus thermomutatus TaxID=41047 RepID=A0A397GY06_ASPTH|nr:uncharacterized protein CDV56_106187 [Aspergillus thermomutatus]RHZ55755.1 hypothetical protein CDV56_106187 [Aspergillus thermomutatus]
MTDQSKKRRAAVTATTGSDSKRPRRAKPEDSDSDEPIALDQIPPHPPSPPLPRSTRATAPAPAARRVAPPLISTGSIVATYSPCIRCVKKWTEDDSTICHRDAALGKCRSCSRAGVECSRLPPPFYGPFSAAQKLTGRARRRACVGMKNALEAYERKNDEGTPTRENASAKKEEDKLAAKGWVIC